MDTRIRRWLAVAGVALVTGAGPATAAAARPAAAPAKAKASCLLVFYQLKSYKGLRYCTGNLSDSSLANNHYDDSTRTMDNTISSVQWVVGQGCTMYLYQYANYKGAKTTYTRPLSDPTLTNNNVGDNRISSYRTVC